MPKGIPGKPKKAPTKKLRHGKIVHGRSGKPVVKLDRPYEGRQEDIIIDGKVRDLIFRLVARGYREGEVRHEALQFIRLEWPERPDIDIWRWNDVIKKEFAELAKTKNMTREEIKKLCTDGLSRIGCDPDITVRNRVAALDTLARVYGLGDDDPDGDGSGRMKAMREALASEKALYQKEGKK